MTGAAAMAHTPGPWTVEQPTWTVEQPTAHDAAFRVVDEQDVIVALCYEQPYDTWSAGDNANLIAAAPELLAALAEMAAVLKSLVSTGFAVQDEYGFEHHAISRAQQGRAHAALAAYNNLPDRFYEVGGKTGTTTPTPRWVD